MFTAVWRWIRRALLALFCLLVPLWTLRLVWLRWPNRITAAVMFGAFGYAMWGHYERLPREWLSHHLVVLGGLCNGAVIIRNRGRMPVVGMARGYPQSRAWVRADRRRHRWLWLADRRSLMFFSVGDFFVIVGIALGLFL